eukprot:s2879_g12.t1
MASNVVPMAKARSDLDFVASKDLQTVLSGPVPTYVKSLFEAILKSTRPGTKAESWQQIRELLQGDANFIADLQAYEPEPSDQHRIRDILYSELEVTSLTTEVMALFSPACVLLLRWCHSLGDSCGCPDPSFPLTEEYLRSAKAEAQAARDERAKAMSARGAARVEESSKSKAKVTALAASSEPQLGADARRLELFSVLSGEALVLEEALPTWTYKDIVDRLRPKFPDAGTISLFLKDSTDSNEPMDRYTVTLQSAGAWGSDGKQLQYSVGSAEAFMEQAAERLDLGANVDGLSSQLQTALAFARAALDTLSKADVVEVKSFMKPPAVCRLVLEAVALLLEHPYDDWPGLRLMMNDKTLLQTLLSFDAERVSPTILAQLKWYIENPELQVEWVERISKGAKSLRAWVGAVYDYAMIIARFRALQNTT